MRNDNVKIKIIFLAIIFCGFFGVAEKSSAKTLYINSITGNDATTYAANDADHPWATLLRATWGNTNRAGACTSGEAAQAGDVVLVAAGTYGAPGQDNRGEPAFRPCNAGVTGNLIVFRAVGSVTLQLSSSLGPVIGGNASGGAYTHWDGFMIDEANAPPHADTGPVTAFNADGVVFENLILIGVNQTYGDNHNGIRLENTTGSVVRNCLIGGFTVTGTNAHNGAGIMTYSMRDAIIENNTIYNCGSGVYVKGETGQTQQNNIIRKNLIYDTGVHIRCSFSGGAVRSRIYQNIGRDSSAGGYAAQFAEGCTYWDVVNNTFDGNVNGLSQGNNMGQANNRVQNNIISNTSGEAVNMGNISASGEALDYNLYYDSSNSRWSWNGTQYTAIANWRTASSQDANSIIGDPLYADAAGNVFTLQGSSPAINAGIDILDLDGDSSTSDAVTMGAYITGNETIGYVAPGSGDTTPPDAPSGLSVS